MNYLDAFALSPYRYGYDNPIKFSDINGNLEWKPDKRGNIVAESGDNEFTLQNYIWRNTGSTVTYQQALELKNTVGPCYRIDGKRIMLSDVRAIAGSHIATMLNPGTQSVHIGQEAFLNSDAVKFVSTVMSFAIPIGGIARMFKSLEYATQAAQYTGLLEHFLLTMPALAYALDNTLGNGNIRFSSLPSNILDNIGYENAAGAFEMGLSIYNTSRAVLEGTLTTQDVVSEGQTLTSDFNNNPHNTKENAGY